MTNRKTSPPGTTPMWRALSDLGGSLRRTWERRIAAGVARSYVDGGTTERMVWLGWPGA